jgi:hypothetical protein
VNGSSGIARVGVVWGCSVTLCMGDSLSAQNVHSHTMFNLNPYFATVF